MRFEIPFDKVIYKEQMVLHYNLVWNANLKKNKRSFYFYILSLFAAIIMVLQNNCLAFLFLVIGGYGVLNCYSFYKLYRKNKKNYYKLLHSEMKKQLQASSVSIWELDKDYFIYKCYNLEFKINWSDVKGYRIIENNLFLDLFTGSSYIIGAKEIGDIAFKELILFIKELNIENE
ncbi:hypothetical protein GOQ30_09545 [Flavobacterium sp. TP390]|uniref:YcxB-like protein domain-containing protein n=1 Tax=Flavobacterium profundi TaxID=1774945 RepID=A0A6I4ILP3_9FLAO|nr:hypothetical protein [Flavobacterium profundi]MVO09401.1 hypothetical protein [Flavobacterium profundi]